MSIKEHKHIIIRAEVLEPPRDEQTVTNQIKDLIEQIGMKNIRDHE